MVLSTLKSSAEAYLGTPVCNAVITVPAYFNDSQRQATKDAGIIAGFNVLRIINEPTAAALSYRHDEIEEERNVLIFDLGGGTFDVSILSIEEGIFEVRGTGGNTHLGGEDFDARLLEYCISEFTRKHRLDLRSNNKALRRLRTACEQAKRTLSTATQASIDLDALHEGENLHVVITRACFEELIQDLVQQIRNILQQVLYDANMTKENIEEVVLIGGSARIPYAEHVVTAFFGKKPSKTINMDEAVAHGAAIQAAILNKNSPETVPDVLLVDVTPLSLGVAVLEENMDVIIERNSNIPTKNTKTYYSTQDKQTEFKIQVFEGNDMKTVNNNKLGEFILSGVPPMRKGKAKIDVTFYIDADGIVHVSAMETTTKNESRIKITSNKGRLSQSEILRLTQKAEIMKHNDEARRQVVEARDELELLCQRKLREGQAHVKYCQNMLAWLANDGATAQIEDIITKRREFQRFIDNEN
ncbi:heat shock 70 kDa protein cognate 4-like [Hyposmocoma kahamanoa]|uniref:heat shock 70 kDa protein cognate 4-like n=1 Tax=Hyposmocoma kahamanoa TaxID=1477025 RepID=UPI000E6DA4A0|nr:heat shock 70 kDa protein cognate 4-like [Hyposmocoma kahamanoa]